MPSTLGWEKHTHTHTKASPCQSDDDLLVPFPQGDVATLCREFSNTVLLVNPGILTKAESFPLKVPTIYLTGR